MKPLERITLLCAFVTLVQACSSDRGVMDPVAPKLLAADVADENPQYGLWAAPVNLGPVVNSAFNDQHPSISRDNLSLYFVSNRPGGFGGNDIWVTRSEEHTSELQSPDHLV